MNMNIAKSVADYNLEKPVYHAAENFWILYENLHRNSKYEYIHLPVLYGCQT